MTLKGPTLEEAAEGIKLAVAEAIEDAHARGLPVFVSDDTKIYAIYPGGRRVVVQHLPKLGKARPKEV